MKNEEELNIAKEITPKLNEESTDHSVKEVKNEANEKTEEKKFDRKEKISLKNMSSWQKRRLYTNFFIYVLIFGAFIISTATVLYQDKTAEEGYWRDSLTSDVDTIAHANELNKEAIYVTAGTYIENLKKMSIKESSFSADMKVWFRWSGDESLDMAHHFHIYKGTISGLTLVKDFHEDGINYQLVSFSAVVSKNFWTKRFPLESHQLRVYLESDYTVNEVDFIPDKDHSSINESISLNGYKFKRNEINNYYIEYSNSRGDPEYTNVINPELVTAVEINRDGAGTYFKCFIALVGTITWLFIAMFINTYHAVDPLSMVPAALFGTVSNIMVGANLLPDALETGLLEYVNIFGIMIILLSTIVIINTNRIRTKYNNKAFAKYFGQVMMGLMFFFTVLGNILLPVISYLW